MTNAELSMAINATRAEAQKVRELLWFLVRLEEQLLEELESRGSVKTA